MFSLASSVTSAFMSFYCQVIMKNSLSILWFHHNTLWCVLLEKRFFFSPEHFVLMGMQPGLSVFMVFHCYFLGRPSLCCNRQTSWSAHYSGQFWCSWGAPWRKGNIFSLTLSNSQAALWRCLELHHLDQWDRSALCTCSDFQGFFFLCVHHPNNYLGHVCPYEGVCVGMLISD